MAEKIRYTRKDLKGPDEFISTFGRIVAWSNDNRTKVVAGALILVGVLALIIGGNAYFKLKERRAAAEIWPFINEALKISGGAIAGDMTAVERELSSLADRHTGTRSALFAKYFLGGFAFNRGEYDESAELFQKAVKNIGKDPTLAFLLHTSVGSSLESKGKFEGAVESYGRAAEISGPSLRTIALFDKARALELAGKTSEAIALYRQIVEENPESLQRDLIEIKIARME